MLLLILAGCKPGGLPFLSQTYPHQNYGDQLKKQGLNNTRIGKQWLNQARLALKNPVRVEVPFAVNGVFYTEQVEALAWKFALKRGASINVSASWQSPDSSGIFIDLFQEQEGKWKHLGAPSQLEYKLSFESKEEGNYLLRIQPELLGAGRFSLQIQYAETYSHFPVQGKDSRAIWSVFGDERDGGKRQHEGIDIFAERGTPVVAPVSGMVSTVRNGGLGGKSVWMQDSKRGHSLYFAHLDSQAVQKGKRVQPGDTLGFVGNSGNARNTQPHLHFGIYARFDGAVNPYPFVDNLFKPVPVLTDFPVQKLQIVKGVKANLRYGPGTSFDVIAALERGDLVWVKGYTADWVQVETPSQHKGFIHSSLLASAELQPARLAEEKWAFWDPFLHPADSFRLNEEAVFVLGKYENYQLLQDRNQNDFWVSLQ